MDVEQRSSDTSVARGKVDIAGGVGLRPRIRLSRQATGYLFIMPAMLFRALVNAYPILTTVWMSFTEIVVRQKTVSFVGLQNYAAVFKDPVFWQGLKNTIIYTVGSMVLHLLVGGFLAVLLNEKWANSPIRNFARGLLILPWLFSLSASALMWALLYSPFGPLNYLLTASGLAAQTVD